MASLSNDPGLAKLQCGAIVSLAGEPELDRATEDAIQASGGLGSDRGTARDQVADVLNGVAGSRGEIGLATTPFVQDIGYGIAGR